MLQLPLLSARWGAGGERGVQRRKDGGDEREKEVRKGRKRNFWDNGSGFSSEMEFLDINITKTPVFCSMLFTVPSTGGFQENYTLLLVLKILSKKQENSSVFINGIL